MEYQIKIIKYSITYGFQSTKTYQLMTEVSWLSP